MQATTESESPRERVLEERWETSGSRRRTQQNSSSRTFFAQVFFFKALQNDKSDNQSHVQDSHKLKTIEEDIKTVSKPEDYEEEEETRKKSNVKSQSAKFMKKQAWKKYEKTTRE